MEQVTPDRKLFIDRFKGRANKVDRKGLSFALEQAGGSMPIDSPPLPKRKLASLHHRPDLPGDVMEKIYGGNPESKRRTPILPKISTNVELPSTGKIGSSVGRREGMPPSRSISEITPGMEKRHFGKYLQLNEEGMRHFEFLLDLEQRRERGLVKSQK